MITIQASAVLKVTPHLSKDASRPEIGHIRVEPAISGVLLVATDGHTLVAYNDALAPKIDAPYNVYLTPETIKALKSKSKDMYERFLYVTREGRAEVRLGEVTTVHIQAELALPDGIKYPEWRQVLERYTVGNASPENTPTSAFNPNLLALFDPEGRGVTLTYGKSDLDPIVVLTCDKCLFGVIMPMGRSAVTFGYPDWLGLNV